MFYKFWKTMMRRAGKNLSYTAVNVAGLTVSITACLLIFLIIQFESSFDAFHADKERIYRVGSEFKNDDGISYIGAAPLPVAHGLRIDFPQLPLVASVFRQQGQLNIRKENQLIKLEEERFFYAEPEFFQMFHFPFIRGDARTSFKNPNDAVITEAAAIKMFGSVAGAIGKTFSFNRQNDYTVTGILKNPPANTDFPLSIVVPYTALQNTPVREQLTDWVSVFADGYTFIKLPPEMSEEQMNHALVTFVKKHKEPNYQKDGLILQPLTEMHFDKRFGNYNRKTFSHELIAALRLIGIFLIIIACVNFVNLATAQAVNRSKEIAIKKILGTGKHRISIQFFLETGVIVFFSCLLAVGLSVLTLPAVNNLLEANMPLNLWTNAKTWQALAGIFLLTTLLAGFYPALVVSNFKPITALRNKIASSSTRGLSLRRGLVIFQFAIAQILIFGMLIVLSQMDYFRTADLGFDKDAVLNVHYRPDSTIQSRMDTYKQELFLSPAIREVSLSFGSPSSAARWQSDFIFDHRDKPTNWNANLKWADADYFKVFNLQFLAGHPYSERDTVTEVVVNERFTKMLGLGKPADAIGKQVDFWEGSVVAKICGVVKDFHSTSLEEPLAPVLLGSWKPQYRVVNVKVKQGMEKSALAFMEKTWNKLYPDLLFDYTFLDEALANFYKTENQLSQLYKVFAGIAIFISCLGLYGLVSFMAVQRTKEVGVRKVLGATPRHIVFLLSKEFTILITVAFLIATPVAWYLMNRWLQDYAYRIHIGPGVFLLTMAGSQIIAWLTVSFKAIKAALANPVISLKSE